MVLDLYKLYFYHVNVKQPKVIKLYKFLNLIRKMILIELNENLNLFPDKNLRLNIDNLEFEKHNVNSQ